MSASVTTKDDLKEGFSPVFNTNSVYPSYSSLAIFNKHADELFKNEVLSLCRECLVANKIIEPDHLDFYKSLCVLMLILSRKENFKGLLEYIGPFLDDHSPIKAELIKLTRLRFFECNETKRSTVIMAIWNNHKNYLNTPYTGYQCQSMFSPPDEIDRFFPVKKVESTLLKCAIPTTSAAISYSSVQKQKEDKTDKFFREFLLNYEPDHELSSPQKEQEDYQEIMQYLKDHFNEGGKFYKPEIEQTKFKYWFHLEFLPDADISKMIRQLAEHSDQYSEKQEAHSKPYTNVLQKIKLRELGHHNGFPFHHPHDLAAFLVSRVHVCKLHASHILLVASLFVPNRFAFYDENLKFLFKAFPTA